MGGLGGKKPSLLESNRGGMILLFQTSPECLVPGHVTHDGYGIGPHTLNHYNVITVISICLSIQLSQIFL